LPEAKQIAGFASAKRRSPSLNETHQTSIVAPPSVPKNPKQDDSRPGKSAFYRPPTYAQQPARRRQARKPLTTNFRSTLSNNNGSPRPSGPSIRISEFPVMNDQLSWTPIKGPNRPTHRPLPAACQPKL